MTLDNGPAAGQPYRGGMDCIDRISRRYRGELLLHPPYRGKRDGRVPEELYAILCISDGISETMRLPDTHQRAEVGWILYPHQMILEWTEFYAANYGTEGAVFADDGADCAYCIRPGGTVACISGAEDREARIADTLWDFFGSDTGF